MNRFIALFLLIMMSSPIFSKTTLLSGDKPDTAKTRFYFKKAYSYGIYHSLYQVYLDSILAEDPTNAYYWQQKGMPMIKANKTQIGMPCLDSAVKYDAGYLDYRAFMKCIFTRDYQGALKDFEQAKKLKGNSFVMDHSYSFYSALCYLQMNDIDQADSLLTVSIRFYQDRKIPVHHIELFYVAVIQMERLHFNQAVITLDEVLRQYPQFPEAFYYKAYCMEVLNQSGEQKTSKDEILALYRSGLDNFKSGYRFNEDNAIYEDYPYQVRINRFENAIKRLTE